MSLIYQRGRAQINANLTPMIDVTFLLIVFFVLVSQIVEVEHVEMNLPTPEEPVSEPPGEEQRVVINVVPGIGGRTVEYRLGAEPYPADDIGVLAMTDHLERLYDTNPAIRVNLRADRRTHYEWVEPVIRSISAAAGRMQDRGVAARVNLVVVRED